MIAKLLYTKTRPTELYVYLSEHVLEKFPEQYLERFPLTNAQLTHFLRNGHQPSEIELKEAPNGAHEA